MPCTCTHNLHRHSSTPVKDCLMCDCKGYIESNPNMKNVLKFFRGKEKPQKYAKEYAKWNTCPGCNFNMAYKTIRCPLCEIRL